MDECPTRHSLKVDMDVHPAPDDYWSLYDFYTYHFYLQEPAVKRRVTKKGPNTGREFWCCARGEGKEGDPLARSAYCFCYSYYYCFFYYYFYYYLYYSFYHFCYHFCYYSLTRCNFFKWLK